MDEGELRRAPAPVPHGPGILARNRASPASTAIRVQEHSLDVSMFGARTGGGGGQHYRERRYCAPARVGGHRGRRAAFDQKTEGGGGGG